jgi:disulfide bond formation protein DsbB
MVDKMVQSIGDWVTATLSSPFRYFVFVALVSAGMLGTAFTFQYVGGLYPCVLCIYQRIPYAVVIVLGLWGAVMVRSGGRLSITGYLMAAACALAFFVDAGVAGFHVGVEQGWWSGTDGCVGGEIDTSSLEAMRQAILEAPSVRCDDVAWSMMGISMAGWNGLAAIAMAVFSLVGLSRWRRE